MSMLEDAFKGGNIATGLAVGIGAAVLIPLAMPILRPISKVAVKAGLSVYDQGRVAFSELSERTNDLVAEARAEMDEPARATTHRGRSHERDRERGPDKPHSSTS